MVYWFYTYAGLVAQWDSGSPLNKWCAPRLEGCSRVKEDGGKDSQERTNLKKSESMRLGEDCLQMESGEAFVCPYCALLSLWDHCLAQDFAILEIQLRTHTCQGSPRN